MILAKLRARLLSWYRAERRDLPWRGETDAYRVWVSEVMLQQTRVETVKPYYTRFVATFPTLDLLAEAPVGDVLAAWSGLGYYRRARALHAAVRECAERYNGEVPRDPAAFGELPGVGAYTRAAVMSIAYGVPLPVVDGNVVRVIARLDALAGHAKAPGLARAVLARMTAMLLTERDPGEFNQAVMELGAIVCTPRAPRCPLCPWRDDCAARAQGDVERWPAAPPRAPAREVLWTALRVVRRGRILVAQRGLGRWQGMWELPWVEGVDATAIGPGYGLALTAGAPLALVRHSVLRDRVRLTLRAGTLDGRTRGSRFRWVSPDRLRELGMSSVWRKALAAAG